jgi:accessory colonization factor AcfC
VKRLAIAILITLTSSAMASAETVRLYAAGSLRAALTEAVRAFEAKSSGLVVEMEYAASGLLREHIEKASEFTCSPRPMSATRAGSRTPATLSPGWLCSPATSCARWCARG